MSQVLVLAENHLHAIAALKVYAETHRIPLATLKQMADHSLPPVGDEARYVIDIPLSYKVVFSVEEQPVHGWCRHISVSHTSPLDPQPRPASPEVVAVLMKEMGFITDLMAAHSKTHPIMHLWFDGPAINVLEKIEEVTV